jgi:hypothetical protein
LITNHHGVAGIVTTLVSGNDCVSGGEEVNDLGLSFVTPLGANYNSDGHERSPFGT